MQHTMKHVQGAYDTSQSCSCTSCLYRSGSDRLSPRRLRNKSSLIHKLAHNKNIPLREQKLIEKLIKTRAVYDDVRKQLLSESNISINKTNLKPRKRATPREVDNIEKSAILQLVDLVDKGMAVETNKLIDCCSCCSCSSKVHFHNNKHKGRKHIRHAQARSGPHLTSKSSVTSKQRQRKEPKPRRNARLKIKRVWSDPCRCTLKFSGLLERQSKLLFKQKSAEQRIPFQVHTPVALPKRHLPRENLKKSLQKIRNSKTIIKARLESGANKSREVISDLLERHSPLHPKIGSEQPKTITEPTLVPPEKPLSPHEKEKKSKTNIPIICKCTRKSVEDKVKKSLRKLKHSKSIMKGQLQSGTEKSVEKLRVAKNKIKERMQSMHTDYVKYPVPPAISIQETDEYRIVSMKKGGITNVKEIEEHQEEIEENRIFKLKKDSITKFKEKLKRKKLLHEYECEPECFAEECIPEECFQKIKIRKARRGKRASRLPDRNKQKKKNVVGSLTSDINIQLQEGEMPFAVETEAENNEILYAKKAIQHPTLPVKTKDRNQTIKIVNQKQKSSVKSIKSKDMATSGHTLKRCFCTLKLKSRHIKPKITNKGVVTSSVIILEQMPLEPRKKNTSTTIDKMKHSKQSRLLPYECEPGICIPNECDPNECLKMINKREGRNIKRHIKHSNTEIQKTRSTSSLASRSIPHRAKKVQSNTIAYKTDVQTNRHNMPLTNRKKPIDIKTLPSGQNRQIVRIGSSFSFNIEFIKENPRQTNSSPIEKEANPPKNTAKTKLKQGGFQSDIQKHQKGTFLRTEKKEMGTIGSSSKRCFCTLDLIKNAKLRSNVNHIHTSTETHFLEITPTVRLSKATKTKQQKIRNIKRLEPFQCEPGICLPDECNPYKCLEIMNRRENRYLRESGTTTRPSKMKSISSVTKKLDKSKSTLAQSKSKNRHTYAKTLNKNPVRSIPLSISSIKQNSRQVVTIGSTFSFNVEFSKSRSKPLEASHNILREDIIRPVRKVKNQRTNAKKISVTNEKQQIVNNKNVHNASSIKPMLKRCFCTLKLQNSIKKPRTFTVSRLITGNTKINNQEKELARKDTLYHDSLFSLPHNNELFSKHEFKFKEMKDYFHKNKQKPLPFRMAKEQYFRIIENHANFKLERKIRNYCTYSEACFTKSKKAMKSLYFKKPYFAIRKTAFSDDEKLYRHSEFINLNISCSDVTGVNPLLKRCYCTMNIQIPNATRYDKLKPYECEPGVCIPNECDPYECQKLIMKRLMRKTSTMSGTDTKSILSHGSQSTTSSKARRLQSGRRVREKKKAAAAGIKYALPSKSHKQAVRIGSSFSFNIEFSKDNLRSKPDGLRFKEQKPSMRTKPVKTVRRKSNTQGTSRSTVSNDRDSQSLSIKTRDMPSSTSAMLKRCFCTLKLQKVGKQKYENNLRRKNNQETMTKRNKKHRHVKPSRTSIGQNTKAVKPEILYRLDPYECEPNTCVPGECDPYECLERIKLRNVKLRNFGSGSDRSRTNSTSSSTTKYKTRSKGKQMKSRFKDKTESTKKNTSKKPSPITQSSSHPSRQAVRIGSSFSFNVEFYKGTSDTSQGVPNEMKSYEKISSHVPNKKNNERIGYTKRIMKEQSSQDKMDTRHKDSQQQNFVGNVKSTMTTSLLKRCFCTKELHSIDKKHVKNVSSSRSVNVGTKKAPYRKRSRHIMKKCFCVLKLLAVSKNKTTLPPTKAENLKQLDKGQVTDRRLERQLPKLIPNQCEPGICVPDKCDSYICDTVIKHRKWRLKPYECEPGICVPGKCDPYVCDKLIKQRKRRLHFKSTNTNNPRTNSSSSSYMSNTSRGKQTQIKLKPHQKKHVASHPSAERVKKIRKSSITSAPSTRQVVRIGSNFSFNVEFYKEKSPSADEIQTAARAIAMPKNLKRSLSQKSGRTPNLRNKAIYGKGVTMLHRQSQAKTQTANRGAGSALKRCFCTLKLQNQQAKRTLLVQQHTVVPVKAVPKTFDKGVMIVGKHTQTLEPYECEPYICIPGECDPQECLKRINKRHVKLRESGMMTKRYRAKSASSMAYSTSDSRNTQVGHEKYKDAEVKTKTQKYAIPKPRKSINPTLAKFSRQAVKVGSSFSLDIEFFKERSQDVKTKTKIAKPQKFKPIDSISISTNIAQNKNKMSQGIKYLRHKDSQVLAGKRLDKMTGVQPLLKRCFCTLKLQKSNIEPKPIHQPTKPTKTTFGPISKDMRNKVVYLAALQPYECEPGVCVPYECDPLLCEKKIRQRMAKSKETSTNKTKLQTSSSSYSFPKKSSVSTQRKTYEQKAHKQNTYTQNLHKLKKPEFRLPLKSTNHHVRFGSNFTIGVDFYKDSSVSEPSSIRNFPVRYKPKVQRKETMTNRKNRDIGFDSNRKQRHSMATAAAPKTESRCSSISPLKRCFCTLKLQKSGKIDREIRKRSSSEKGTITLQIKKKENEYQKTKNTGIGTKKVHNLEPYECEPNVCIPGQCDPHKCYERIKRRQVRNSSTDTGKFGKKYHAGVEIEQLRKGLRNLDPNECEPNVCIPGQCDPYKCLERIKRRRVRDSSTDTGKLPKKAIGASNHINYKSTGTQSAIKKIAKRPMKQKRRSDLCVCTKAPCVCTPCPRNIKVTELSPGDWPNPQRYIFIQDLGNDKELTKTYKNTKNNKNINFMKINDESIKSKKTTDDEPKYKKTKKQHKYRNEAGNESMATNKIMEKIKLTRRAKDNYGNQQVYRIGSKLSIDLEFYKVNSQNDAKNNKIKIPELQKCVQVSKSHKQTDANHMRRQHQGSQVHSGKLDQGAQMCSNIKNKETGTTFLKRCFCTAPPHIREKFENKQRNITDTYCQSSSFNALKRCFCTLKLHSAKKKQNVVAVNRVTVEERNMFRNPNCLHNLDSLKEKSCFSDKRHELKKYLNENMDGIIRKNKVLCYYVTGDYKEMKTIYPYMPRKFNKHTSKTVLLYDNEQHKRHCGKISSPRYFETTEQANIKKLPARTKQPKRLTAKQSSTSINRIGKEFNFKAILYRIVQKLKINKRNLANITVEGTTPFIKKQRKCRVETRKKVRNEILKPSYSDRYRIDQNVICDPKKSKSLKINKLHEDNIFPEVVKKKYSRFQSGDSAQNKRVPAHNSRSAYKNTVLNSCNDTFSQIHCNKKQPLTNIPLKSAYADDKLVQFSLITHGKNSNCRGKCNECTTIEKKNKIVNTTKQLTQDKKINVISDPHRSNLNKTLHSEIKKRSIISIPSAKKNHSKFLDKYFSLFKPKCFKSLKINNEETCIKDPCYDRKEKCTKIRTTSKIADEKPTSKITDEKPTSIGNNFNDIPFHKDKDESKESRNKEKGEDLPTEINRHRKGFLSENNQKGKNYPLVDNRKGNMVNSIPNDKVKKISKAEPCSCVLNKTNVTSNDMHLHRAPCSPCCRKACSRNMRLNPFTISKQRRPLKPLGRNDLCQCPTCKCHVCPKKNKISELSAGDWPNPQRYIFMDMSNNENDNNTITIPKNKKIKHSTDANNGRILKESENKKNKIHNNVQMDMNNNENDNNIITIPKYKKIKHSTDENNGRILKESENNKNKIHNNVQMDMNNNENDNNIITIPKYKKIKHSTDANNGRILKESENKKNKIHNNVTKYSGTFKIKQQICNIFANAMNKVHNFKKCVKNSNNNENDNSFSNNDKVNKNNTCHKCSVLTEEKNDNISADPKRKGKGNKCQCINDTVEKTGRKTGGDTKTNKKKVDMDKMCICGSKVCKKKFDQMFAMGEFESGRTHKLEKRCVCGTAICKSEQEKQEKIRKAAANKPMTKRQLALQKKNYKLQLQRASKYAAEDEERRTKQIRIDRMLESRLGKEIKTSSNWGLVGDSIVDIAKLGCRTKKGILRCVTRSVTDPKNAIAALKTSIRDPDKMVGNVKNAFSTIGLGPTLSRVGTRICATTPAMAIMDTIEDKFNLQAIGGKKRKKKKKKAKRRQPPVDFACSLFMASLRKKPCLAVYYACPWFYPHCLSFLTMWKQFTDIILFLLAVAVWSPCILAMEICRAFVCCTFCTG